MQCTPEQIEQKRRLAQEKLAKRSQNSPEKRLSFNNSSLCQNINLQSVSVLQNNFYPKANSPNSIQSAQNNSYPNTSSPKYRHNSKPYEKPKEIHPFFQKNDTVKLTCTLISEDRFSVDMSKFSADCVNVFKTIPSRNYDSNTRIWNFLIKDYDLLINKLASFQPKVILEKLPTFVVNLLKIPKRDYTTIDLSKVDPVLCSSLMNFQVEGVCFGIDKKGRCLIADEMGLGKTFQALGIASYYRENWPLLIVTTASMKNVWEETIQNYLPSVPVTQTQYMVSAKDYIGDSIVLIVSYDLMSRSLETLLKRKFGVIIIDESHNLKNFKAKCTKAAIALAKQASRVILLSGTPALSRPSELFTQLSMINERFFGNFFDYSKRYCDGKTTNFGWDASGKSNLQELEIVLSRKFMIRRTKEQVLQAMPNKTQEIIKLDVKLEQFSKTDRESLNVLAEKYSSEVKGANKHAALLIFFSQTAKIKIPSVCSYILQMLEETNDKFLVFAHHQVMLDALENILKKRGKQFIRIDGHTSSDQRKDLVDKFQVRDEYVCALLSITAASAGITLTAAQTVLFAELHWNPSILSQAESRAHRIGQSKPVVVRYLLAPGTADDAIWPLLQQKQKILGEVGLCRDSFKDCSVTKQNIKPTGGLTEGLYFTQLNRSDIHTENYMDYMNNSVEIVPGGNASFNMSTDLSKMDVSESAAVGESDMFGDDGFDDILSNIEY